MILNGIVTDSVISWGLDSRREDLRGFSERITAAGMLWARLSIPPWFIACCPCVGPGKAQAAVAALTQLLQCPTASLSQPCHCSQDQLLLQLRWLHPLQQQCLLSCSHELLHCAELAARGGSVSYVSEKMYILYMMQHQWQLLSTVHQVTTAS